VAGSRVRRDALLRAYGKRTTVHDDLPCRDTLEGYSRLRAIAPSPDHIVPGHDPLVMQLYPPPSPELKGVAVRLDARPMQRPLNADPGDVQEPFPRKGAVHRGV
jgi:hypothetical protein